MVTCHLRSGMDFAYLLPQAVLVVSVFALTGCGSASSVVAPQVVQVTGKLYLNDQPYPKQVVVFFKDSPEAWAARGLSGEDGSFSMKTTLKDGSYASGVVPGKYKVGIEAQDRGQDPILERYTNPKYTPFAVKVTSEGLTNYEVKLKR